MSKNLGIGRVLAVVSFLPYPKNHGDALRRSMLLESINQLTDLDVLAVERSDTDANARDMARDSLPGSHIAFFPPSIGARRDPHSRLQRSLRGLFSLKTPWLYSQWSTDLKSRLREVGGEYDTIIYIGEPSAVDTYRPAAARTIWDKSNVLSASSLDNARSLSSTGERAIALLAVLPSFLFELRASRTMSEVWVTSEEEKLRFHSLFGRKNVRVLKSVAPEVEELVEIDPNGDWVWMSSFQYPPNWDGLCRLLVALEATAKASFRLRVIGAGATAKQVEHLAAYDFVTYMGFQEDLGEACAGAAGAVVPVWAGAGVKLKTLTLMQLGLPVIATPVAMEGIPIVAACFVSDTASDLVSAINEVTTADLHASRARAMVALRSEFSRTAFDSNVVALLERKYDA